MSSAPSMVSRTGDALVIRSVVSGNELYIDEDNNLKEIKRNGNASLKTNDGIPIIQYPYATITKTTSTSDNQNKTKELPQCKIRRNYACIKCNYFTQNPREYLHHLRDIHGEKIKIYECHDCLYASRHLQKLSRHIRIVHNKMFDHKTWLANRSNDEADTNFDASLRKSRKRKSPELNSGNEFDNRNEIIMNKLNQMYFNMEGMNQAEVSEEDSEPQTQYTSSNKFKCPLCPFSTSNQAHFFQHEKQDHETTKFFKCYKCEYVTHIKARFTKHVKYHSMPMIKCEICDFSTPYKWNLDRHMKNHNGREGVFRCRLCNFTADIKQSLTVHEMNHHLNSSFSISTANNLDNNEQMNSEEDGGDDNDENKKDKQYHYYKIGNLINGTNTSLEESNEMNNNNCSNTMSNSEFKDNVKSFNKNLLIMKITNKNQSDKKPKPLPNLIPIQKVTNSPKNEDNEDFPINLIKNKNEDKYEDQAVLFPIDIRVKTKEQLNNEIFQKSMNSSLRDFTSLFDDNYVEITPIHNKLKEQNDFNEDIDENNLIIDDEKDTTDDVFDENITMSCKTCNNFTSKNIPEIIAHRDHCKSDQNNHQDEFEIKYLPEVNNFSSLRCQNCRQRCKSTLDLITHLRIYCTKKNETEKKIQDTSKNRQFEWNNLDEQVKNYIKQQFPEQMTALINDNGNDNNNNNENRQQLALLNKMMGISMLTPTVEIQPLSQQSNDNNENVSQATYTVKNKRRAMTSNTNQINPGEGNINKRVFKCPHCSFWATTASRFHVHIVGHLNKKPFECSLCAYRSNWRWDITKHIRLKSVRDPAHATEAKVLMTDETGRRNYTKYNRYLVQLVGNCDDINLLTMSSNQEQLKRGVKRGSMALNKDNQLLQANATNHIANEDGTQMVEKKVYANFPNGLKITRSRFLNTTQQTQYNLECDNDNNRYQNELKPANVYNYQNRNQLNDEENSNDLVINLDTNDDDMANEALSLVKVTMDSDNEESNTPINYSKESPVSFSQNIDAPGSYAKNSPIINQYYNLLQSSPTNSQKNSPMSYKNDSLQMLNQYGGSSNKSSPIQGGSNHSSPSSHSQTMPYRCGHCPQISNWKHVIQRHCRLKHDGNIKVIQTSSNDLNKDNDNNYSKCNANQKLNQYQEKDEILTVENLSTSKNQQMQIVSLTSIKDEQKINDGSEIDINDAEALTTSIICRHCGFIASAREILLKHIKDCHESPKEMDENNDENNENDLKLNKTDVNIQYEDLDGKNENTYQQKRHRCTWCPYSSNSKSQFTYHLQFHQAPKLEQSNNNIDNNFSLNNDIKMPNLFKCSICNYSVTRRHLLQQHMKLHYNTENQDINKFEAQSPSTSDAEETKINELVTNIRQFYQCRKCPEKFLKPVSLVYHVNTSHSDSEVQESIKQIDSNVARHKKYKCEKCPTWFDKISLYNTHISLHGANNKFTCPFLECGYSVKNFSTYLQHVKRHKVNKSSKENGFVSPKSVEKNDENRNIEETIADKQILKVLELRRKKDNTENTNYSDEEPSNLVKIHPKLGDKIYLCSYCPYYCNRRDKLDSHLKRHKAIRNSGLSGGSSDSGATTTTSNISNRFSNQCPHCDYSVSQAHYLKEHLKVHFSFSNPNIDAYMYCMKNDDEIKDLSSKKIERETTNDDLIRENDDFKIIIKSNDNEKTFIDYKCNNLEKDENEISDSEKVYIDPKTAKPKNLDNPDLIN